MSDPVLKIMKKDNKRTTAIPLGRADDVDFEAAAVVVVFVVFVVFVVEGNQ
jgi:hypothetical protein